MSGKTLLASLLATCGLSAGAASTAGDVARGKPGLSEEDSAAGTQSLEQLVETAHTQGMAEGRKAERERFGAVLTDEGTTGKLGLAISLLSTTDLGADTIMSNLKAAKADAPAPAAAAPPKPAAPAAPQAEAQDPIAGKTPIVTPGAPQASEAMEEKEIVGLWGGAIASVHGGGITEGGVWAGLGLNPQPRAAN